MQPWWAEETFRLFLDIYVRYYKVITGFIKVRLVYTDSEQEYNM